VTSQLYLMVNTIPHTENWKKRKFCQFKQQWQQRWNETTSSRINQAINHVTLLLYHLWFGFSQWCIIRTLFYW